MNIANWLDQEWVKNLITLTSIIAAILAWVAKLRWSKEYSDAKEEQIKAKQAHVDLLERENKTLRENSLDKVLERYASVQRQLEGFIEKLGKELDATKQQLENNEAALIDAGEREEKFKKEIAQKEEQILKAKSELVTVKSARDSGERLERLTLKVNPRLVYLLGKEIGELPPVEEDHYTPYPKELTVENIVKWFFENYEDPANGVPWDGEDKEYVYVYGGPYQADEELWAHFPDADEDDIEKAVNKIESDGIIDWVKQWQY